MHLVGGLPEYPVLHGLIHLVHLSGARALWAVTIHNGACVEGRATKYCCLCAYLQTSHFLNPVVWSLRGPVFQMFVQTIFGSNGHFIFLKSPCIFVLPRNLQIQVYILVLALRILHIN